MAKKEMRSRREIRSLRVKQMVAIGIGLVVIFSMVISMLVN